MTSKCKDKNILWHYITFPLLNWIFFQQCKRRPNVDYNYNKWIHKLVFVQLTNSK